ncbi:putative leucine-rich repeat-containing protein DDB_G0290503 [Onthophagus taurus]|uniref:putative leucine-rich repeat-containing protein DDB_G0290503 n=1 Tax=Onthophagus taurus TaxID=166361 RepID=UPI0039BE8542
MAPDRIFNICFITLLLLIALINALPNPIDNESIQSNLGFKGSYLLDSSPIEFFSKTIRSKRREEVNKDCQNINSKLYEDVFKIILPLISLNKPVPIRDLLILLNLVRLKTLPNERKSIEDYLSSPYLSNILKRNYEIYYKQISDDDVRSIAKTLHIEYPNQMIMRTPNDEEKPNKDYYNYERGDQDVTETPDQSTPSEEKSRGEDEPETPIHPSGTEKARGEGDETTTQQNERGDGDETTTTNPDENKERGEDESDENKDQVTERSEEDESDEKDEQGKPLKPYRSGSYFSRRHRRPKWKLGYGRPLKDLSQYQGSRFKPFYGEGRLKRRPYGYLNRWNSSIFNRQRDAYPDKPIRLPSIIELTTQKTVSYDFSLQGGGGEYKRHPINNINRTQHKIVPEVNVTTPYLTGDRLRKQKKDFNKNYVDEKYYNKRREFKEFPNVNVIAPSNDRFKRKKRPKSDKNENEIKTLPITPESFNVFKKLFIKGILKIRPFHQLRKLPIEIISKLKYEPNLTALLSAVLNKIGKQPSKMLEILFKNRNGTDKNVKKMYQVEKELFEAIENVNNKEIIYQTPNMPNYITIPDKDYETTKTFTNKLKYKEDILNNKENEDLGEYVEMNHEDNIDSSEESKTYKNGVKIDIDEEDTLLHNSPHDVSETPLNGTSQEFDYDIDPDDDSLLEESEPYKNGVKIDIDEEDVLLENSPHMSEIDNEISTNDTNDDSLLEESKPYKNGVKIDIDEEDILLENAPDNEENNEYELPESNEDDELIVSEISKDKTKIDIDEEDVISHNELLPSDDDDNEEELIDGSGELNIEEAQPDDDQNDESEMEESETFKNGVKIDIDEEDILVEDTPENITEENEINDSELEDSIESQTDDVSVELPTENPEESENNAEASGDDLGEMNESDNEISSGEESQETNTPESEIDEVSIQEKSIIDDNDDINNILLAIPGNNKTRDIKKSNREETNFGITYEDSVQTTIIANNTLPLKPEKPKSQIQVRKQKLDSKQIQKGGSKNGVELIYEDSVITRKRPINSIDEYDEYDNEMYGDYKTIKEMIHKPNPSSKENIDAKKIKNAHNKAKIELIYEDVLHVVTKKRNNIKDFDDINEEKDKNDFVQPQNKIKNTPPRNDFSYEKKLKRTNQELSQNKPDKFTPDVKVEPYHADLDEDENEHFELTYEDTLLVKHHNKELGNKLIPIQKWFKRNQPQKSKQNPDIKRVFKRDSTNNNAIISENNLQKAPNPDQSLYRSSRPLLLRKKTRKTTKPGLVTSLNPKDFRYRDISPEYDDMNQMENGVIIEENENTVDRKNGTDNKKEYSYIIEETEMQNDYNPLGISIEIENGDENQNSLDESEIKIII